MEVKLLHFSFLKQFVRRVPNLAGGFVEKRKTVRYALHSPVILRWVDQSGAEQEDVGRTLDISVSGTFVVCHTPLPVGAQVSLEVHLPPFERITSQRLRLKANAIITRVTQAGEKAGFATCGPFILV